MLMNNLDPDVAESPADLVVYGGAGKAARDSRRGPPRPHRQRQPDSVTGPIGSSSARWKNSA